MNEIQKLYKNAGIKNKHSKLSAEKLLKLIEWCAAWGGLELLKTSAGTFFTNYNIWGDTLEEVIAEYINGEFAVCYFGEEEKEEIKRILE